MKMFSPGQRVRSVLPVVLGAGLLAGCVSPGARAPKPAMLDAGTLAGVGQTEVPAIDARWWTAFGDPQLDALVERALAASPTITVAAARLHAANAAVEGLGHRWRPELDAGASAIRQRVSATGFYPPPIGGETVTDMQLGLSLSWDIDLWGRKRSAISAANYRARAAEVEASDARLLLATEVTRAYLSFDRASRELATALASRDSRAAILALTMDRRRAGLDTDVEVESARGALAEAEGEIASAEEAVGLLRHEIAALCGDGPAAADGLASPALKPAPALAMPATLPAALVARRPDVAAAKLRAQAAADDIEAARAAFYPDLNLAAALGLETITPASLLNGSSHTYSFGPALTLPVFGHAPLRGNLHGADAAYEQAVAGYNAAVVDAFHQVADGLESLRDLDREEAAAHTALASLRRAFDLASLRYKSGLADYLAVLVAQDHLLAQERLVVDLDARRADLTVILVRALGGGYAG